MPIAQGGLSKPSGREAGLPCLSPTLPSLLVPSMTPAYAKFKPNPTSTRDTASRHILGAGLLAGDRKGQRTDQSGSLLEHFLRYMADTRGLVCPNCLGTWKRQHQGPQRHPNFGPGDLDLDQLVRSRQMQMQMYTVETVCTIHTLFPLQQREANHAAVLPARCSPFASRTAPSLIIHAFSTLAASLPMNVSVCDWARRASS
ncbi:hypothetical protein QBC39DRAFT_142507 [Podospora conica]|nr:hypothetical protein QBC39DRAFT_142507 [Schizothecium conicum]